jgi:hypothetical protein
MNTPLKRRIACWMIVLTAMAGGGPGPLRAPFRGQIVGTGLHDGQVRAFLLTPALLTLVSHTTRLVVH